jgi:hypothetical protein
MRDIFFTIWAERRIRGEEEEKELHVLYKNEGFGHLILIAGKKILMAPICTKWHHTLNILQTREKLP